MSMGSNAWFIVVMLALAALFALEFRWRLYRDERQRRRSIERWTRASTAELLAEARRILGMFAHLAATRQLLEDEITTDAELLASILKVHEELCATTDMAGFIFGDSGIDPLMTALERRVGSAGTPPGSVFR